MVRLFFMNKKKKQVVILHGGSTFNSYRDYLTDLKGKKLDLERLTQRRWRDNIAQKLGDGFEVLTPTMPNSNNAKYLEWKIWFKKIKPFLRNDVVFVGHSLGGIFLAKYLSENKFSKKIMATFLIAAPFDDTGGENSLADFSLPKDLGRFEKHGGSIFLYYSADDFVVPLQHLEKYKNALPGAKTVIFHNRGHFNQESFSELVKALRSICAV